MPMASSDYFSALPDAVICHILSFLPTKCAAETCFLSKRWTPLWLCVPVLDFEEEEPRTVSIYGENDNDIDDPEHYTSFVSRRIRFLELVHCALFKRDVTQSVKKFRLKTCYSEGIELDAWVNAAIRRGIEHLELILSFGVKLPCDVVGSRTLVEFPEVTCTFRNLTSLELRVDIFRIYANNLDCHFIDVFKVLQHSPKLQNLEILMKADSSDVSDKYKWVQPKFVPQCFSSHVMTCTLRGCKGWDSEFQFAKYVLQNAKVLCSMRFCSELFSNPLTKLEMSEKLSSFPWGSETCELHLDVMRIIHGIFCTIAAAADFSAGFHPLTTKVPSQASVVSVCSSIMSAKYVISAVVATFGVAYVLDYTISDKKIFGGTTPGTVSNKGWWEETDKKFQSWPRTAGPPVVMNPISRQNFIVKPRSES
ncbi:hypothetical protein RIF29_39431 [Crotalaria pallida]|uniref:FBD domain-containing protein n=1 Tax=Crotalaria pallida TaxID=3830 RepID=A0AAN9HQP7_CROPI